MKVTITLQLIIFHLNAFSARSHLFPVSVYWNAVFQFNFIFGLLLNLFMVMKILHYN